MRKTTILLTFAMLFASLAWTQSQRRVLIEEVNNISAPISAGENSSLDLWMLQNPDKQIKIQYQANSPALSPMYTEHVQERMNQYNIAAIPTAVIDGIVPDSGYAGFNINWYAGAPAGFTPQMIENRYAVPSPFEIEVSFTLNPNAIIVNADVLCTQSVSGNLKLRFIVIERQINFDLAPGNNGQVQYKNVFRAFAGSAEGISLNEFWEPSQYQEFSQSWDHENIFSFDQLAIVAIIQDDNSLDVLQSAVVYSANYSSELNNAAKLVSLEIPHETCSGNSDVAPIVSIRNTGINNIIGCQFSINVNGAETFQTVELNLPFMADTFLVLNAVSYAALPSNNIEVTCISVNELNNEDFNNSGNGVITTTENLLSTFVNVIINTDCYPEETRWKITSANGSVTAEGGPYTGQANSQIIVPLILGGGCYRFEYFDSYGDGLHGSQWNGCITDGNFTVIDTAGHVLFGYDGSYDLDYFEALFEADIINSIESASSTLSFNVYPNPTSDFIFIEADGLTGESEITLYNGLGQVILSTIWSSGSEIRKQISFNQLESGVYFVRLMNNGNQHAQKIIVSRK
jgi:hypothetical protein